MVGDAGRSIVPNARSFTRSHAIACKTVCKANVSQREERRVKKRKLVTQLMPTASNLS